MAGSTVALLSRLLRCCCPGAHDPEQQELPSQSLMPAQQHLEPPPQTLESSEHLESATWRAYLNAAAMSDQKMHTVSALCGVEIAHLTAGMQAQVQETGDDFQRFFFPRRSHGDYGECFTEWLIPTEGLDDQQVASALQRAVLATNCSDESDIFERAFYGERGLLGPLLRLNWDQLGPSFKPLPNTAQWAIQRVDEKLMPVLRDEVHWSYLLLPTSADCTVRTGTLTIPDPYRARDPAAGHEDYMNFDIWFENCDDGGVYVLGLDETVLIFYVDGPGNMVCGRWQCGRGQWESMWLSAFGSLSVQIRALDSGSGSAA